MPRPIPFRATTPAPPRSSAQAARAEKARLDPFLAVVEPIVRRLVPAPGRGQSAQPKSGA
jgi:hypothetical protein